MTLDETDVKIIKKLLSHARLSYRTIAEEINVSPPTGTEQSRKVRERQHYKVLFSNTGS